MRLSGSFALALVVAGCNGDADGASESAGSTDAGATAGTSTTAASASTGGSVSATSEGTGTSTTGQESTSTSAVSDASTSGSSTSTTGATPPPCDPAAFCAGADEAGICRHELTLADGMSIYYWGNLSLTPEFAESGCQAEVERLVLVQHGNSRNPWSYFDSVVDAAVAAGVDDRTLIIAPYFPSFLDGPPPGFHLWAPGSSGWKSGDASTTPPGTSSFAVYDELLLDHIADTQRFPALTEVVVTGHSAGGQFSQRYAVASEADAAPSLAHLSFRYVVLNPSSWLYLDAYRWDGEGAPPDVAFALPNATGCDDTYDDYKYGLAGIPLGHYVGDHLGAIPASFLDRDVTYLLGDADTQIDDGLDVSCEAYLQGANRYERGQVFAAYLDARYPAQEHALVVVPGVGHSKSGMYESAVGVATLFPK
ncbi:MAG: hypothetical protein KC486_01235 [Myxococcales bacterium]|nr:hypothetical protein [Myxococcales bacterium]